MPISQLDKLAKENQELKRKLAEYEKQLKELSASHLHGRTDFDRHFRLMADNSPDLLWSKDINLRYTFANKALCDLILGVTDPASVIGLTDVELTERSNRAHPDIPDFNTFGSICESSDREVIRKKVPMRFDEVGYANGVYVALDVYKAPIIDDDGELVGIVGSARVVTTERRAEEALRESRRMLEEERNLFLDGPVVVFKWKNAEGWPVEYVSHNVEKVLGYSSTEFMDAKILYQKIIHPEDLPTVKKEITDNIAQGNTAYQHQPYRLKKRNGEYIWVTDYTTIICDEQGEINHFTGYIIDITEQKQAEEALNRSETLFRAIIEQSGEGIGLADKEGNYILVNPKFCEMSGYSEEELLQMNVRDLITPETGLKLFPKAIRGEAGKREFPMLCKDGSTLYVEIYGYPILLGGERLVLGIVRDIEDRIRAEKERLHLESQIQQAQKLESLGVLAGGIAHDFNNLLTGILGNAGLACLEISQTSPALASIKNIETTAVRAAELCRQLLAYSGKGRFVLQAVNVNELVEEMTHLLNASISKKVIIKYNFAKNLPAIEVDTGQLRQIIMNLIINASDAIEENSGVITITTGVMTCDREYLKSTILDDMLTSGDYVYIEIADTGMGMSSETIEKIFDPFYTTKFTGRGLGLAAVLGILRSHKGAIKVYSEPGRGSTFKVLFPVSQKSAEPLPSITSELDDWKGSGTVLVVDDEQMIRNVAQSTLTTAGFSVITAANGREAISLYRQHADQITLVLLDMTMPHLNGEETYRELRRIRQDVRVILSSGYNEQETTSKFVGKGLAGFLQKPYRPQDLLLKVKALIDDTPAAES